MLINYLIASAIRGMILNFGFGLMICVFFDDCYA